MSVSYVTLEIKQASSTTIPLDKPVLVSGFGGMRYTSVCNPFAQCKMI
jgi:hypothetical protein